MKLKIKLSCWNVMGVPTTKAECLDCGKIKEYYGTATYKRAEQWKLHHTENGCEKE